MLFQCKRYPYLSFYVGGVRRSFANTLYRARNDREIEVLNKMKYVQCIDKKVFEEKGNKKKSINKDVTIEDINALSGFNEELAQAIIDDRPYKTLEDISRVKGVGKHKVSQLKEVFDL